MINTSIWRHHIQPAPKPTYEPLKNSLDLHFDVAIVGGGMFGCTAAYYLQKMGKRVVLLEGRRIGTGVTGSSTAKITSLQGAIYSALSSSYDHDVLRAYYEVNQQAIDEVEKIVKEMKLDCEFERKSHTTWTSDEKKVELIQSEFELCTKLQMPCELKIGDQLRQELPASLKPLLGVSMPNQAQFNPYKYCVELCKKLKDKSGPVNNFAIYEDSRVSSITEKDDKLHLVSLADNNAELTANHVVIATHIPPNDMTYCTVLQPSRTHCIAVKVPSQKRRHKSPDDEDTWFLENMFITIDKPTRSLRTTSDPEIIVVAGNSMKQGSQSDTNQLYEDLETWAKEHLCATEVVTRWSAMDFMSADHMPYMGFLNRSTKTMYTATGMNKWGLTNSVGFAAMLQDLVNGKLPPTAGHEKLLNSGRLEPKGFMKEQVHAGGHLVADKLKHMVPMRTVNDLNPGEGGIVHVGTKKVGAYIDTKGVPHFVDPVCTHLGCDLVFNDGDKKWDCPCHGSEFSVDGDVIHGPAVKNLCQLKELAW